MKSKIEEKIEKAREATNEMFAAFDELNERLSEKLQPEFKEGDYFYCQEKEGGNEWLSIFKKSDKPKMIGSFADYLVSKKSLHLGNDYLGEKNEAENLRLQTPSEIALLDSKLAEQGKRFDKEKLEIVDIPKHKEPIIGEMAIFWNFNKCNAHIRIFTDQREGRYIEHIGCSWNNAILFESSEQYKAFLKS